MKRPTPVETDDNVARMVNRGSPFLKGNHFLVPTSIRFRKSRSVSSSLCQDRFASHSPISVPSERYARPQYEIIAHHSYRTTGTSFWILKSSRHSFVSLSVRRKSPDRQTNRCVTTAMFSIISLTHTMGHVLLLRSTGQKPHLRAEHLPSPTIGIGGGLATSPLPHHRTYGSRIRWFGGCSQGDTSPQPEHRFLACQP